MYELLIYFAFLSTGNGYEEPSTQEKAAAGPEGIHH